MITEWVRTWDIAPISLRHGIIWAPTEVTHHRLAASLIWTPCASQLSSPNKDGGFCSVTDVGQHWPQYHLTFNRPLGACCAVLSRPVVSDSANPWTTCSLPGPSVHGILQTRILEWVAMPSSRGSSRPRDRIQVFSIAGRFFTIWATREAPLGA